MKNFHQAILQWAAVSDGGKATLPTGGKYSTVARFELQGESWTKEAWSLVVEFIDPPDSTLSHRVRVAFLADGPDELFQPGSSFELMEGSKPVAKGRILDGGQ